MTKPSPVDARAIRIALASLDMSQGALAEKIGMTDQGLSMRLLGKRPWRLHEALAVAKALEVPLSQIVPEAVEPERVP